MRFLVLRRDERSGDLVEHLSRHLSKVRILSIHRHLNVLVLYVTGKICHFSILKCHIWQDHTRGKIKQKNIVTHTDLLLSTKVQLSCERNRKNMSF